MLSWERLAKAIKTNLRPLRTNWTSLACVYEPAADSFRVQQDPRINGSSSIIAEANIEDGGGDKTGFSAIKKEESLRRGNVFLNTDAVSYYGSVGRR